MFSVCSSDVYPLDYLDKCKIGIFYPAYNLGASLMFEHPENYDQNIIVAGGNMLQF